MLISLDRPNGAGKSTLIKHLSKSLKKDGLNFIITKEPTESEIGQLIRNLHNEIHGLSLACLIAADRYHHIKTVIEPNLKARKIVISDRYFVSSLVYQVLDNVNISFIQQINSHIIKPNLNIIVYCDSNNIKQRLLLRNKITRFEKDFEPETELKLFEKASKYLSSINQSVLEIDNSDNIPIHDNISKIRDEINKFINFNNENK